MVLNAWAIGYRLGKWCMERKGKWDWGREMSSYSLTQHFARRRRITVREFSVGGLHSIDFLSALPSGQRVVLLLTRGWRPTRHSRPPRLTQGYLLVTIAEK